MNNDTLKLLEEFNRYFISSNDVDVPARVSVSRDEWRQLYKSLKEQNTRQVPMTMTQVNAAWDGLMPSGCGKSRYDITRLIEAYHGITAQCVNTTKKEDK